ncbi:MAG: NFACT family protein [Fimbriimonadaceae bacterium]|nr:NFACT family protein [Fimbriimonadaceae bacterium]
MRAPFDVLSLAAVADEAQSLVGSALERVWEPEPRTVVLGLYAEAERWFLLCASPGRTRAHLISRRPSGPKPRGPLANAILSHLEGAVLTGLAIRGDDRTLDLCFDQEGRRYTLVAELHGRMPNLILVDPAGNCLGADRWLGPGKSSRPVVPKKPYVPVPGSLPLPIEPLPRPDLVCLPPFAKRLAEAGTDVAEVWRERAWSPVFSPDLGAYPLPVSALGIEAVSRESFSQALEQAYASEWVEEQGDAIRRRLLAQVTRVTMAREVALRQIEDAVAASGRAGEHQAAGELLLAYQHEVPSGASEVALPGFDGLEMRIRLDPDSTVVENATLLFAKAKRARARAAGLGEQRARFESEIRETREFLVRIQGATSADELEALALEAEQRRWVNAPGTAKKKQERPFEGHAVRESLSPGGWRVMVGENATANDYLTSKVARPRDLWFHVRGAPSSHVVLATNNQPQRVQTPDILFAATLAAKHSNMKHSSYVSVDYTEKRYVRKPKGAAPGLAVYSNEKTVHIEP